MNQIYYAFTHIIDNNGSKWKIIYPLKMSAEAGMAALNSVMPAQAGIQLLFEKVAHDLEKEQMAKIFDRSDGKATEL